jgi:hypothetical protein
MPKTKRSSEERRRTGGREDGRTGGLEGREGERERGTAASCGNGREEEEEEEEEDEARGHDPETQAR